MVHTNPALLACHHNPALPARYLLLRERYYAPYLIAWWSHTHSGAAVLLEINLILVLIAMHMHAFSQPECKLLLENMVLNSYHSPSTWYWLEEGTLLMAELQSCSESTRTVEIAAVLLQSQKDGWIGRSIVSEDEKCPCSRPSSETRRRNMLT